MLKLRRIDVERSGEIFSKIEKYKQILVQEIKPDLIMLFGSLARMDFNEGSDVDLLVVADFEEAFLDRIKRLLELNEEVKLPLESVGYTLEEFLEMLRKG
ncbi:MAG: nucleotidyltransferase domain-containing protein, partial [Nitrososphaerota archaeon]